MAKDLGFTPKDTGEIYFVSYKKEDYQRVGEIARCLDEIGVPMWYDEGIRAGDEWEKTISVKIHECKAVIVFATKEAFSHEDSFLKKEYDRAKEIGKDIYVMWLEKVHPLDPVESLGTWYTGVRAGQGLEVYDQTWDKYEISLKMVKKFDLIHSIEKVLDTAFRLLKDGKYDIANQYCNLALTQAPKNADAYLGKLMAEKHVSREEDLANCDEPLESSENYQKVLALEDERLSSRLRSLNTKIVQRIQKERLAEIYADSLAIMNRASLEGDYQTAAKQFQTIIGYEDAEKLAKECRKMAEVARKASAASESSRTVDEARDRRKSVSDDKKLNTNPSRQRKKQPFLNMIKGLLARKWIYIAIIAFAIACIVVGVVLVKVVIPRYKVKQTEEVARQTEEVAKQVEEQKAEEYQKAVSFVKKGDYKTAYSLLDGLDYNDSEWLQSAISCWDKPQHQSEKIVPGSYYVFGAYEQDNNLTNGKEDIEWLVLARGDNRILVTSRFALDCQPFNDEMDVITWETCSLRKWLNQSFFEDAFSEREQSMVLTTMVNTDIWNESTEDKIFLLSVTEAEHYFATDSARKCIPSPYAIANGAYADEAKGWWWLRSPGYNSSLAACVYPDGFINVDGGHVNNSRIGVRPALWLNL